jgi:hypothetical protein
MREIVINGEKFFVFQDVCREVLGRPVRWRHLWRHVSPQNQATVELPVEVTVMKCENAINAAGIEEIRKGIEEQADPPSR